MLRVPGNKSKIINFDSRIITTTYRQHQLHSYKDLARNLVFCRSLLQGKPENKINSLIRSENALKTRSIKKNQEYMRYRYVGGVPMVYKPLLIWVNLGLYSVQKIYGRNLRLVFSRLDLLWFSAPKYGDTKHGKVSISISNSSRTIFLAVLGILCADLPLR